MSKLKWFGEKKDWGCIVILSSCLYPPPWPAYPPQRDPVKLTGSYDFSAEAIQKSAILLRIYCLIHGPSLSAPLLPLGSLIYYSSAYFTSDTLPSWCVFELAKHTGPSAALCCGSLCPDRSSSCYPQGSLLPPGFHWNITFTVRLTLFLPSFKNCTL